MPNRLIYIPPGKTDTYQPLDVAINGAMKSIGKRLEKEEYIANPSYKPTIANSIKSLIEAKSRIKSQTIKDSFRSAGIL